MSLRHWIYIGSIICVGIVLSALVWPVKLPSTEQLAAFAVLTVLATLAQFIEFPFSDDSQAYYPHMVFFFAGVILLPPFLFVCLIIIPHVAEMVKGYVEQKRPPFSWHVQFFNISVHIIAGLAAQAIYGGLQTQLLKPFLLESVVAATLAAFGYVFVNHLLVGFAMIIVGDLSWQESGVMGWASLVTDFILLYMGYAVAMLWDDNPWLVVPAVSPIVLMYRALLVPRLTLEAQTDSKTGLLNAGYFNQRFAEELENARRLQRPLALIMADLDLLRVINNTYGHLAGDAVLAGVGKIIQENLPDHKLAGRFGGEELAIVLPGADQEVARALAERIRVKIETSRFELTTSAQAIQATMSFGIACYPVDGATVTNLIYQADIAVYHAKISGRNRVMCLADLPQAVRFEGIPTDSNLTAVTASTASTQTSSEKTTAVLPLVVPQGIATTSTQNSAPPPATASSMGRAFVMSGVIASAMLVTLLSFLHDLPSDGKTIVLLVFIAIIAELLPVDLYRVGTISASVAISFAAAILVGMPGVIFVSAAIAVTAAIVHTRQTSSQINLFKTTFNWATHVLAGALPAAIMSVWGLQLNIENLSVLVAWLSFAALGYFLVESGLIALVIGLSSNTPFFRTWTIQFRWLAGHYLVLCIMGLFFSLAYRHFGVPGMVVFVLPILMMRYSQVQYVEQTEDSIRELKRLNQELARANQSIASANNAIQQLNNELFMTLAQIIDARDPYVSCHAAKVADYAVVVAKEMKLPAEQTEQIRQASLLHDIGKIAISEQVLQKKEKLTDAEFEYVKSHAAIGAAFLETSQGLRHLAGFVRHHHEWWNGGGYPDKLHNEEIPFESRIVAVCDAVEVMASDRPYRRPRALPEIISELRRMSGVQFDPAIVEIFIQILEREGTHLLVNSAPDAALHALRWHPDWPGAKQDFEGVNAEITQIFSAPGIYAPSSRS